MGGLDTKLHLDHHKEAERRGKGTQKQLEKTTKKYDQIFDKKKVKDRQKAYKELNKKK